MRNVLVGNIISNLHKTVAILVIGIVSLSACAQFADKPTPPTRTFKTIDLLISIEDMPPNWEVSSGPVKVKNYRPLYPNDASIIVFNVIGDDSDRKGASYITYMFADEESAKWRYERFVMRSPEDEPVEWSFQSEIADHSFFDCNEYGGELPSIICKWAARYEEFIVEFLVQMNPDHISLNEVEKIVIRIDEIMGVHLNLP